MQIAQIVFMLTFHFYRFIVQVKWSIQIFKIYLTFKVCATSLDSDLTSFNIEVLYLHST